MKEGFVREVFLRSTPSVDVDKVEEADRLYKAFHQVLRIGKDSGGVLRNGRRPQVRLRLHSLQRATIGSKENRRSEISSLKTNNESGCIYRTFPFFFLFLRRESDSLTYVLHINIYTSAHNVGRIGSI